MVGCAVAECAEVETAIRQHLGVETWSGTGNGTLIGSGTAGLAWVGTRELECWLVCIHSAMTMGFALHLKAAGRSTKETVAQMVLRRWWLLHTSGLQSL